MNLAFVIFALLFPSQQDLAKQESCQRPVDVSFSFKLDDAMMMLEVPGFDAPHHMKQWLSSRGAPNLDPFALLMLPLGNFAQATSASPSSDLVQTPQSSSSVWLKSFLTSGVLAGVVASMVELELSIELRCDQEPGLNAPPIPAPQELSLLDQPCLSCALKPSWLDAQAALPMTSWQQRMAQQSLYYDRRADAAPSSPASAAALSAGPVGQAPVSRYLVRSRAADGSATERSSAPGGLARPVQGLSSDTSWVVR